jgi:hypothetical protein
MLLKARGRGDRRTRLDRPDHQPQHRRLGTDLQKTPPSPRPSSTASCTTPPSSRSPATATACAATATPSPCYAPPSPAAHKVGNSHRRKWGILAILDIRPPHRLTKGSTTLPRSYESILSELKGGLMSLLSLREGRRNRVGCGCAGDDGEPCAKRCTDRTASAVSIPWQRNHLVRGAS